MVDVVSDQTELSYAENTTGWSGDSFVSDTEILVQGNASNSVIQTNNGTNDVIFTKATGSWSMTGSHIRMYMLTNISANMSTTNAIQVFASDGTNTAYWTVAISAAAYGGGWRDFFFDISTTPTTGTVNTGAVTSVGIRINTITKPRNAINGWYDNWRFGNGLEINSTTTEAISFTDVATEDALIANQYDILQNTDGVLFAKGKLTLGNAAAAKNCNLVSLNETIFFIDANVSTTLYAIVGTEGTGLTDIDITGLVCKTVGNTGAELDFSAAVNSFSIDGSTFIDMGTMSFNTGSVTNTKFNGCGTTSVATTQTYTNDSWIGSGLVTQNSATFTDCVFDSSASSPAILVNNLNVITGCDFISAGTGYAMEITVAGTYSWVGNTHSGYGADLTANAVIFNNSGGLVTINFSSGDIPTYNNGTGATTSVVATFTLTLTDIPSGVNVTIVNSTTRAELQHSTSTGVDITYGHSGGTTVDILLNSLAYDPNLSDIYDLVLPSADSSIKFQLLDDLNYENPA